MIVFCHIPKTAGMAVKHVLESNLGTRFVSSTTWGKARAMTTERDLKYELLAHPRARAIGGHGMRPFVDYGARGQQFRWFTVLREPRARLVSHYVYDLENGRAGDSFEAWLRGDVANYQVRWIAGEEDLEEAKRLLVQKFALVGLQEHFRETLVLLDRLLFDGSLQLASEQRVNATRSSDKKRWVSEELDRHPELVAAATALDDDLYQFARDRLWNPLVSDLGGIDVMRGLVERRFLEARKDAGVARRLIHRIHRNGVYKPMLWCARALGARR